MARRQSVVSEGSDFEVDPGADWEPVIIYLAVVVVVDNLVVYCIAVLICFFCF